VIFYREQFKKHRQQTRWSLPQLARYCGVNPSTLSRWESGKTFPIESHVRALANILNVSVSEISDLPDNRQNTFIDGLKEFNKLSDINKDDLKKEETFFITRIRRQREQVEKANLVIRSLLSSINSIFYIKDNTNKYVVGNSEFLKLINALEFSDIEGKSDEHFFPLSESEQNAKIDKSVLELKAKIVNKQVYIPGTRKKKWGLMTKVPIQDKEGKVEGMLCTIKDITVEKELHSAIGNIEDVVWTGIAVDYQLKYTTVNAATQKLLGLTEDQFRKDEWKKHIHPDFMEAVKAHLKDTKSTPKQIEYKYIHPVTRKTRWLQNRVNIDGQHHFGIIRDVTEQKEQQVEKEIIINVLNYSEDAIWLVETDIDGKNGRYIFHNNARAKLYELDVKIMYKNQDFFMNYYHPEDRERIFNLCKKNIEGNLKLYYRLIFPDNRIKFIEEFIFATKINTRKYSGGIQRLICEETFNLMHKKDHIGFLENAKNNSC
jgi:PAS domain S-box-containing protein